MIHFPIDRPRCVTCQHYKTKYRRCIMMGGKPFIEYETQLGVCTLIRTSKGDDLPTAALYPPRENSPCRYKPWVELP